MFQPIGETVIVVALRKGNVRRAVELLIEIYHEDVFAYCASLAGLEQAMRSYQQLLLRVLERLPSYTGEASLRAWLYEIVRQGVLSRAQDGATPVDFAAVPRPVKPVETSPALRLKDAELEEGFDSLDLATREVLQLTLWQELSLEEVAYVTRRSVLQTRQLAAHGLALLSSALQRYATTPS